MEAVVGKGMEGGEGWVLSAQQAWDKVKETRGASSAERSAGHLFLFASVAVMK